MFKFQFLLTQINICIFFILTYKRINECSIVFVVKIFFLQFNDSFTRYIFCYISCFILSYRVLLVCFRSQCYSYSCCICHKPVTLYSFQETRIRLQQKNPEDTLRQVMVTADFTDAIKVVLNLGPKPTWRLFYTALHSTLLFSYYKCSNWPRCPPLSRYYQKMLMLKQLPMRKV